MASKPPKLLGETSINEQLAKKRGLLEGLRLQARRYQKELYQKALEENVVIYLGTGLGKTFITVLYLQSPIVARNIESKRKIAFLAPTQDLVKQQADYINGQVNYRVKIYCGRSAKCGNHIDHWSKEAWAEEVNNIDILFMTPMIFSAAISTNNLSWNQFSAVIFDEVHHACRNKKRKPTSHPYVLTLNSCKMFHQAHPHLERPRLIGLTASLINSVPKNRDDIKGEVQYLENLMSARCVTDIEVQDQRPSVLVQQYSPQHLSESLDILMDIFASSVKVLNAALNTNVVNKLLVYKSYSLTEEQKKELAFYNRLKLAAAGFSIKPANFPKVFEGLLKIRTRCGLWMLRVICDKLIKAVGNHSNNSILPDQMRGIYLNLMEILQTISSSLNNVLRPLGSKSLTLYTRVKPMVLLEVLTEEYKRTVSSKNGKSKFSCIIFVQSRLEVVALSEWLQNVSVDCPEYNFIKCDYAIGLAAAMTSKYSCITKRKPIDQYKMLDRFRNGLLNTIITTSVLEEGIDLPVCSTVIRYDIPNNFRQYIQSRGRARQAISSIIFLCMSGEEYVELRDMLNKFNDFEITLKETLGDRTVRVEVLRTDPAREVPFKDKEDFFTANEGSILISTNTAKTILHMYCNQLSKDIPFTEGVRYERVSPQSDTFQTILYLPSTCPVSAEGIKGGVKSSEALADSSAVVAAVKFLKQNNELNEHFAPTRRTELNVDKLLAKLDLDPKIEMLSKELEGIVLKKSDDTKEVTLFEPILTRIPHPMRRNFLNRTYKLITIGFESTGVDTRRDTQVFFEKPVFGFIVDQSISAEFIPSQLYSHYGQFKVLYKEIPLTGSQSFLNGHRDHEECLKYTHRLLTKCLSINLKREELSNNGIFYIVPLNDHLEPNISRIRSSFFGSYQAPKVADIVRERNITNDRRRDGNRLLMIKSIRKDMNEKSIVPGKNVTFEADANYKYGGDIVNRGQTVIEVIPISKDFGHVKLESAKKVREDYSSSSLFYLEQFLEPFDDDPYSAFQAFLLPEIIYRLYLTYMAQELDRNFVERTSQQRGKSLVRVIEEQEENNERNERDQVIDGALEVDKPNDDTTDDGDTSDDDEYDDDEDDEYDSDARSEEDGGLIGNDYLEMINKRTLDLNKDDDDGLENLKRWDLSEYNVPNLRRLDDVEVKLSPALVEAQLDQDQFSAMKTKITDLRSNLVDDIQKYGKYLTSDATFLDENAELEKRKSKVNRSIDPPIKFDRNTPPLKEGSRVKSLLEALTQRRAQETYSLEGLENVGDSYLKYVVSVVLYSQLEGNEGFLTAARSRLTCNKYFTYLAKKKRLGAYAITTSFCRDRFGMFLGRRMDFDKAKKFYNRMRPKSLADTFEAIIGSYLAYHGEFEASLAIEWLGLDLFKNIVFVERHENAIVFARAPTALMDTSDAQKLLEPYKASLRKFEVVLDYKFGDISYLVQAMTHASSLHKITRSYERLEFVGDAILDFLVTMTLIQQTEMNDPGQITSSRSALVNNYNFARLAMMYKFDLFIIHSNAQLYDELNKLRMAMEEDPGMSFMKMSDFDKIVKLLADVFESVAAAIFYDSGCSLDVVWSVYYPMLKDSFESEIKSPTKNAKVTLYESFPGPERVSFLTDEFQDSEGEINFRVKCRIIGYDSAHEWREFEGIGLNKRQAALRAVEEAVRKLPPRDELLRLNKAYQERYPDKYQNRPSGARRGRGGARGGYRTRGGSRPTSGYQTRGNWRA